VSIKNPDGLLKTFFNRRTDNQLIFLMHRLIHNYQGDLADFLGAVDNFSEIEVNLSRYFQSATSSFEFFEMIDNCAKVGRKEFEKRKIKEEALL
jgi:hypothetical protein